MKRGLTMKGRKILTKTFAIFIAFAVALCSAPPALTAYAQESEPVIVYFGSYYQDPITDESQIQIISDEVKFTNNVGELSEPLLSTETATTSRKHRLPGVL